MITFKQKNYSEEDRNTVIGFLGVIQGWKTKTRNFHWSALGKDIHEYLEDFEKTLVEKQDEIAETYQGLTGQRIGMDEVKEIPTECQGPLELIDCVISCTLQFYEAIPENLEYCGLRSVVEELVAKEQKTRYLFGLCA